MPSDVVGPRRRPAGRVRHDQRRIPAETLAADDDIVGPYYLWRLLIDARFQGRGYGAATIDAVVAYLGTRPDAEFLLTSCEAGAGSPQPFYLHYGFVLDGGQMGRGPPSTRAATSRSRSASIRRPRSSPAPFNPASVPAKAGRPRESPP